MHMHMHRYVLFFFGLYAGFLGLSLLGRWSVIVYAALAWLDAFLQLATCFLDESEKVSMVEE